jgi:hypothetical protein
MGATAMKLHMSSFGEIEVDGERFEYDLVIERGKLRKRQKRPSKAFREGYGHTPLSAKETIPWHGTQLYIGTGMYGRLPVMPEVYAEARSRGVDVVAAPTPQICEALAKLNARDVNAILHVTC